MRTAEDFVELACQRHGISYYRVAQHLEISPSRLVRVRKGEISITERQAEKLAELVELEPGIVYAEAKAARAKRTEVRAFWERVARALAAVFAVVFLGIFTPPADAAARGAQVVTVYIMRTWRALAGVRAITLAARGFKRARALTI